MEVEDEGVEGRWDSRQERSGTRLRGGQQSCWKPKKADGEVEERARGSVDAVRLLG